MLGLGVPIQVAGMSVSGRKTDLYSVMEMDE